MRGIIHVHLIVYSAKDNDGFLTKAGIEVMRSELAHDIFRQNFAQIYEGQNLAWSSLKQKAAERMCQLADGMLQGVCENPVIGEELPPEHKAKWFAGAALNTADQAMASVLSTVISRLNAFLDSEMKQILCFDGSVDTETLFSVWK